MTDILKMIDTLQKNHCLDKISLEFVLSGYEFVFTVFRIEINDFGCRLTTHKVKK